MLLDLLTIGVLAFVGVRLVGGARLSLQGPGRVHTLLIVKGIRLRHVFLAPFVLIVVLIVAGLLHPAPGAELGLVDRDRR